MTKKSPCPALFIYVPLSALTIFLFPMLTFASGPVPHPSYELNDQGLDVKFDRCPSLCDSNEAIAFYDENGEACQGPCGRCVDETLMTLDDLQSLCFSKRRAHKNRLLENTFKVNVKKKYEMTCPALKGKRLPVSADFSIHCYEPDFRSNPIIPFRPQMVCEDDPITAPQIELELVGVLAERLDREKLLFSGEARLREDLHKGIGLRWMFRFGKSWGLQFTGRRSKADVELLEDYQTTEVAEVAELREIEASKAGFVGGGDRRVVSEAEARRTNLDLSIIHFFPSQGRIEYLGSLGLGYQDQEIEGEDSRTSDFEASGDSLTAHIGAGFRYNFNDHRNYLSTDLRGLWIDEGDDWWLEFSMGVGFRFGRQPSVTPPSQEGNPKKVPSLETLDPDIKDLSLRAQALCSDIDELIHGTHLPEIPFPIHAFVMEGNVLECSRELQELLTRERCNENKASVNCEWLYESEKGLDDCFDRLRIAADCRGAVVGYCCSLKPHRPNHYQNCTPLKASELTCDNKTLATCPNGSAAKRCSESPSSRPWREKIVCKP